MWIYTCKIYLAYRTYIDITWIQITNEWDYSFSKTVKYPFSVTMSKLKLINYSLCQNLSV